MPPEVAQCQLYVDAAYIRADLVGLGISPWFGPVELQRPLLNLRIDGRGLSVRRTIFYDAVDARADNAEQHEEHLDQLGRLPDTLVRLGTVTGKRPRRQKGVDMRIGMDMMVAARSGFIEYIVLAAGDADFIPAVQQIQDLGPKVIVLAFPNSLSPDLVLEADRVIELPTNRDRTWSLR